MFSHPRRSHNGCSIPTWLTQPGPVLMKNHVRMNKYEPLVQEVELIEANPDYAHVKLPDGRETTVSIRHLAPRGESTAPIEENINSEEARPEAPESKIHSIDSDSAIASQDMTERNLDSMSSRPARVRQPPNYLKDYFRD